MRRILLFIVCLWVFASQGQGTHYNFYNLSTDNGLPTNEVQHIYQDSYGYLWLATNSGLVRWDGYGLRTYAHRDGDAGSISDNIVYTVYEDSRKRLWVGTIDGLNLYDRETDRFKKCRLIAGNDRVPVNGIVEDRKGRLWLATSLGLCSYEDGKVDWVPVSKGEGNVLFAISVDGNDDLWAGSYNGGVMRVRDGKVSFSWRDGVKSRINAILNTREGEVWIGSELGGLTILDSSGRLVRHYANLRGESEAGGNPVAALYEDRSGTVWIGVRGQALYYKEKGSDMIRSIDRGAQNNDNSRPVSIASITEDNFGNTWFASLSGGLFYNNIYKNVFGNFLRNPGAVKGLRTNIVTSFCASADGKKVMVGTAGDGLLDYDVQTGEIAFSAIPGLRGATVNDVKADEKGRIWIATAGNGVKLYDPITRRVEEIPEYANVKTILPAGNMLWIGTHGEGLAAYDMDKRELVDYRNNGGRFPFDMHEPSWINHLFGDSRGRLWISTYSGVYLYDGKKLRRFAHSGRGESLSGNSVNMVAEDHYGRIWVAGEAGLDRWDGGRAGPDGGGEGRDGWVHFDQRYGLTDGIKSIVMGDEGLLWIGTDRDVRSLNVENDSVRQFDENNGFLGKDLQQKAILKTSGGRLYFGSLKGFSVFDPAGLRAPGVASYFHFTDLTVYNRLEKPQVEGALLRKVLDFTDTLVLSQKQSFFTIGFASMNWYAPGKTRYAYQLDGLQQEWIDTKGDNRISFTNLPHGSYLLRIRYTDVNGVWREAGKLLRIVVLPYWWQTWWFRALAMIAVIMGVTVVFYMRVRAIKRRNRVLKMAVTKRTEELRRVNVSLEGTVAELERSNRTKDHFFSILAHDLKNPVAALSEITGFIRQNVERMDRQKLREHLDGMHHSSSAVYELLVNLLDWSRTQSEQIEIHPTTVSLLRVVRQNVRLMESQFANKHLRVDIGVDARHGCVADYNMVDVVVRNILSNAIKFTDYGGKIEVRSSVSADGMVALSVADTGTGMRKEQLDALFSLDKTNVSTGTAGEKGTGLGLVISKEFIVANKGRIGVESVPGKGSEFVVELPRAVIEGLDDEMDGEDEAVVDAWEGVAEEKLVLLKGRKVLVADDNKAVRDYLKLVLGEQFEVIAAENGREALQKAEELAPDIVISDVLMPEMNGRQLCKKLKAGSVTGHIPVVLLTSQSEEAVQAAGYEAGADIYLTKPVKREILVQVCVNLIQTAGARQESLLNQLLADMPGKDRMAGLSRGDEEFVARLIGVIEKHLSDQELDSKLICRELGISRTILYERLRVVSGQTVNEFMKSVRLRRSLPLLLDQKTNISQIALEVGFSSSSYYHRCFMKEYGISPKEFINKKKKFYSIIN